MTLLDTNILIYGFNRSSPLHPWAWGIIRSNVQGDGAAINPVILAENVTAVTLPDILKTRALAPVAKI